MCFIHMVSRLECSPAHQSCAERTRRRRAACRLSAERATTCAVQPFHGTCQSHIQEHTGVFYSCFQLLGVYCGEVLMTVWGAVSEKPN